MYFSRQFVWYHVMHMSRLTYWKKLILSHSVYLACTYMAACLILTQSVFILPAFTCIATPQTSFNSIAWPDLIFPQGVYRLQYKRPREKGLEQFTAATGTTTIAGDGCKLITRFSDASSQLSCYKYGPFPQWRQNVKMAAIVWGRLYKKLLKRN